MADADDKMSALQAQLTKEREKSQGNLRKLMAAMKTNKELEKEMASLKEAMQADGEIQVTAAEVVEAREALHAEEAAHTPHPLKKDPRFEQGNSIQHYFSSNI